MKHFALYLAAFLLAFMPMTIWAQGGNTETQVFASTFTGNVYGVAHETYSEGTLTTVEGKDWIWEGEGENKNPIFQMTEVDGQDCLSVKLKTSTFKMNTNYPVPGTIKKITFTGGGDIGKIQFGFGDIAFRYTLDMPENGLRTYSFSYEDREIKSTYSNQEIYVTLFPKDESPSSSTPMYIQSIIIETEVEKTGESDIVSVLEHYDSYSHLLIANDEIHNWKFALPADSTQVAVYDANFDGTPCILMQLTGGTSANPRLTFYSDFPVVGKVKKIIVKAAGDIRCISFTKDNGETVDSQMTGSTVPYLDDFVLDFGAGFQMNDILRFHLYAGRYLYLQSITIVMAGGETVEVSLTSTLCDWETLDASGTYLIGEMKSYENNSWFTYINDVDASVYRTAIRFGEDESSAEECMVIVNSSDFRQVEIDLQNRFTVSGSVRKIIVSFTGQVTEVGASIVERGTWENDQAKRTNTFQPGSGFTDVELTFNGAIEYTDADVRVFMVGTEPIFLKSITIVQEGDSGTETELPSGKCGDNLDYALTLLPYTIMAPNDETGMWEDSPAYKLTITGSGEMYDYENWFLTPWTEDYRYNIAEISLPEGMTRVGDCAFGGLINANIASLPTTLKSIGKQAFYNIFYMPYDLRLSEGLTSIGAEAFMATYGTHNIYLPASLTYLGEGAISEINELENFYVDAANTVYKADGNAVIEIATKTLVAGNRNTVIPDYVEAIANWAFYGVRADEMQIPNSVDSIGASAFNYSYLTSIVIPSSVKAIANYAFGSCSKLLSVTIGSGVTQIGANVFYSSTNILDIYCYADPDALTWTASSSTNESRSFKPDKMTNMHVRAADLEKWQEKFSFLNVTFVPDLSASIIPITEEMEVRASFFDGVNLYDTSLGNVYYNLNPSTGNGYTDGYIFITQTTDMSQINDAIPGSSDIRDKFTGIILEVGPGEGVIALDVATKGNISLVVQIGDGTPTYAVRNERGEIYVSYNVSEPTYVYFYAVGSGASQVRAYGNGENDQYDNVVQIYGFSVYPGADETAIRQVENGQMANEIYDLSGRRVSGNLSNGKLPKGIYIVNGKKVSFK